MNKSTLLSIPFIAATLLTGSAQADDIDFDNPIESSATVTSSTHGLALGAKTKTVTLLNITLSPTEQKLYTTFPATDISLRHTNLSNNYLSYLDLGMNNVPVLNQGRHGTCATFATTAAVDALLYHKDHISQLCSLELGKSIAKNSYAPSGWRGSWSYLVLSQLANYGVISKENQAQHSCAGVTDYPLQEKDNTGNAMLPDEYHAMSEKISDKIIWHALISQFDRLQWNPASDIDGEKALNKIRAAFNKRYHNDEDLRLLISTLVPHHHCRSGACGTYKKSNDTWALTNAIKHDPNIEFGGHAMVITGYNDKALVTDNEGNQHEGLLILRNSWGNDVGNNGTFYMSYDFFKQYVRSVDVVATKHGEFE